MSTATAGMAWAAPSTITIPGERVFPESVTSTSDGTLYVGSIVEGGIRPAPPGADEATPWIEPAAHGTRSIFGVLADEGTGTLWACSNDVSGLGIPSPGDAPGSSLKAFDLATGDLKSSAALPGEHPSATKSRSHRTAGSTSPTPWPPACCASHRTGWGSRSGRRTSS